MKCLKRNKMPLWYCLFDASAAGEDAEPGEPVTSYTAPVFMEANVSPATGSASTELFGNDLKYDKVIVTEDTDCPIDENAVLFVDKAPGPDDAGGDPKYDYVVKKVAKSLNSISIAVEKVKVS